MHIIHFWHRVHFWKKWEVCKRAIFRDVDQYVAASITKMITPSWRQWGINTGSVHCMWLSVNNDTSYTKQLCINGAQINNSREALWHPKINKILHKLEHWEWTDWWDWPILIWVTWFAQHNRQLASCLICMGIYRICMWVRSVSRCYRPWNLRKIRCSLSLFFVKNAKIV